MQSKTDKLTQAGIAKLAGPTRAQAWKGYADGEVDGLAVRVMAGGARSFVLRYRHKGTARTYTIGDGKEWSLKEARAEARRLRQLVDQGQDPLAERNAERLGENLRDVIQLWREERHPHMRPRSIVHDEGLVRLYIAPAFGSRKVADITSIEIGRWFRNLANDGHKIRANRARELLGRIFNIAVQHKLRDDNPAASVERFKEHKREYFLTLEELERLLKVLADCPNMQAVRIIRLLLLTGARFHEVAEMRWNQLRDLDGDNPYWWLKPEDTKQKDYHQRPLNAAAVNVLREIRHEWEAAGNVVRLARSPWVFPATNGGKTGHLTDVDYWWHRIRKAADLNDLRIHDLRHSFASFAANAGEELLTVSKLLGHSSIATTSRYSHLFGATKRNATEKVGALISGNGSPK
jgi:integrase